ncbi:MAG TPA: PPC domain-containing DNA-binding protein [Phycisphaerae bacterium]|nr:PPC domain-containing DNA-binding protein [Phycisphaerae bacterium]
MKTLEHAGAAQVVVVALEPGEMLLESIQEAVRKHDIRNGVVISGIGTLKTCQMHYITHTEFPPKDRNFTIAEPLELVSVSGIIADGEPHLHIVLSCGESEVWAGHLEPKSEVAYLAEIAILKFNALEMTRRLDPERKVKLLGPKA